MACQNFIEIPYLLEGVHTLMSPQRVKFATPIRLNANPNECFDRSSIESMHRSDINWANRIVDSHISGTSRSAGAQPVFESITMTIFLQHRTGITSVLGPQEPDLLLLHGRRDGHTLDLYGYQLPNAPCSTWWCILIDQHLEHEPSQLQFTEVW